MNVFEERVAIVRVEYTLVEVMTGLLQLVALLAGPMVM